MGITHGCLLIAGCYNEIKMNTKPNKTSWKKGQEAWNKGKHMSLEMKHKLSDFRKGKEQTPQAKEKNRIAHLGRRHTAEVKQILSDKVRIRLATGWSASKTMWSRIEAEIPALEKQGFRVIPITNVIPDIIAIKGDKVYAVEVEYQRPNYNKYNSLPRMYYDEIIWLVRK